MFFPLRIGHGFDVHAFADHRKLFLGGIEIPHERGLLGHSDADVLIHAIMDAILGALSLHDIGQLFPDSDALFKDIDSKLLLKKVVETMHNKNYTLINCDSTIILQQPKLAPYRTEMIKTLALILQVPNDCVNIKFTTTEHLGFTGRKEGIAAQATVLLQGSENHSDAPQC